VSLILQGAGGGIAATAGPGDQTQLNLGTNIMIAGLSFQVFSLLLFMILSADFALRIRKVPESQRNEGYQSLREPRLFKGFLLGMLATLWANPVISTTANHRHCKQLLVLRLSSFSFDAVIESQSSSQDSAALWPTMKSSSKS
jgi:hypothetical protein